MAIMAVLVVMAIAVAGVVAVGMVVAVGTVVAVGIVVVMEEGVTDMAIELEQYSLTEFKTVSVSYLANFLMIPNFEVLGQ